MKHILITGKDSYIGQSLERWLKRMHGTEDYWIDTVDMRGIKWKEIDFSAYEVVFHVAGIAHADIGKVSEAQKQLYYQVNCDLAVETAKKAKQENVKQFIYMSSIIVYGEIESLRKKRIITTRTQPSPANFYGDSKWKAEQKLMTLSDEDFKISILRPPMIYGEGCKGNYQILKALAMKFPMFPDFPNQKSVLSIDNFCSCVEEIINQEANGVFLLQDFRYKRTAELVREIAERQGKKICFFKCLNGGIFLMSYCPGKLGKMINKAFGSLIYENTKQSKIVKEAAIWEKVV